MKYIIKRVSVFVVLSLCTVITRAETWILTPQSRVGFDIKSMGVSVVKGTFGQVQSKMNFNINHPEKSSVQFALKVNSLNVNKSSLQNKIMGEDLFYVAKYKTVVFKSTQFKFLGNNKYNIQGLLTLRGVTRSVIFNTTLRPNATNGKLLDVYASSIIKRSDFGMEPSNSGIGERVNLQISGQWMMK